MDTKDIIFELRTKNGMSQEELGQKLRRSAMKAGAVQLSIKDEFLKTIQRRRQLSKPTDIAREISALAMQIFLDEWRLGRPIRMLTVTVLNLTPRDALSEQIDIFTLDGDGERERAKRREETIDKIRSKFGKTSIFLFIITIIYLYLSTVKCYSLFVGLRT